MMTRAEIAKEFKVHPNTIDKWRKRGMPCYKIGKNIRFELDQVIRWIKKNNKDGE